jgi:hypothetical protein
MNFKYTPNTLKKLEGLFEEADFTIRYEKGNFNSGYCVLEERRIIVVNKFFNVEGRINALAEILGNTSIDESVLGGDTLKFYHQFKNIAAKADEPLVQTKIDL